MRRLSVRALAPLTLAVVGLTAGCVPDDVSDASGPHRVHRQEIKGGTVDHENTSVVGIVTMDGYSGGICSGTLIAPNLVLTAQHCVAEINSSYVQCGATEFGDVHGASNIYVTTNTYITREAGYYYTSRIHVPPNSRDMCGNDIALIELSQVVPASVTIPIVPRIDAPVVLNESYTAIGYGHDGSGRNSGIRRMIGQRRVQCGSGSCPTNYGIMASEWLGSDGTCQGDSGGAAIDADGRVLGALSRGPDGCLASVYSGLVYWADWMRQIGQDAAGRGGYTAPAWVTTGSSKPEDRDSDLDGINDGEDNCVDVSNQAQADADADGIGDYCDPDSDNDGIDDMADNCELTPNADQADADADGIGDACDDNSDPGSGGEGGEGGEGGGGGTGGEGDGNGGGGWESLDGDEGGDIVLLDDEPDRTCSTTGSGGPAGSLGSLLLALAALVVARRKRWS